MYSIGKINQKIYKCITEDIITEEVIITDNQIQHIKDRHPEAYNKVLKNIQEIKARKGKVIALVTKGDTVISKIADTCIELPETIECLDPLITTVPLQLLAYHIAVCKGMDVDQPRNLAKSVTVE